MSFTPILSPSQSHARISQPGTAPLRFQGIEPVPAADAVTISTPVTTSAREEYLNQLATLVEPFGVKYVQDCDKDKRPPMEVLKAMVESGYFVSGTPVARLELAQDLLNDKALQGIIGAEKMAELQQLMGEKDKRIKPEALMEKVAQEGRMETMTNACVLIPKKTSVGVSTFLGVNTGLSAQTIYRVGTPAQQALWLNALNHGIFTYGFGLTESKVGSNPRDIETTFKQEVVDGKTYFRINGNKKFIGNAARVTDAQGNLIHRGADFLIVFAVDDPNKPPAERVFRAFMVPRTLIGEENIRHTGGEYNKEGLREVNNGDFDLKDVMVPESLMLGDPNDPIYTPFDKIDAKTKEGKELKKQQGMYKKLMGTLDITRLFVGAMGIGQAEAILENARAYSAKRSQNGQVINKFQLVGFPLDILEAEVEAAKLLVMDSSRLVDQAEDMAAKGQKAPRFSTNTAMAKLIGTELAEEATKQGSNTLGGRGFVEDPAEGLGLPKRHRDTKVITIYEGTSNVNRMIIATDTMVEELKKIQMKMPWTKGGLNNNYRRALRFLLLTSKFTSPIHSFMLRATSTTSVDKVNAIYQSAIAHIMTRYAKALDATEAEWKKNGIPEQYKDWDKDSLIREQRIIACLPIQAQMGILSQIIVYRKMLHVSLKRLNELNAKTTLNPQEEQQKERLKLFKLIALDRVYEAYHKFKSVTLKKLEADYNKAWGAKSE